mmetsp:Transcript_36371/g.109165  ORF Transcript_36371/g.109165 Transcript_36371/m.109165 type:complete len:402 (-) Transcript_36371:547-1752(-)
MGFDPHRRDDRGYEGILRQDRTGRQHEGGFIPGGVHGKIDPPAGRDRMDAVRIGREGRAPGIAGRGGIVGIVRHLRRGAAGIGQHRPGAQGHAAGRTGRRREASASQRRTEAAGRHCESEAHLQGPRRIAAGRLLRGLLRIGGRAGAGIGLPGRGAGDEKDRSGHLPRQRRPARRSAGRRTPPRGRAGQQAGAGHGLRRGRAVESIEGTDEREGHRAGIARGQDRRTEDIGFVGVRVREDDLRGGFHTRRSSSGEHFHRRGREGLPHRLRSIQGPPPSPTGRARQASPRRGRIPTRVRLLLRRRRRRHERRQARGGESRPKLRSPPRGREGGRRRSSVLGRSIPVRRFRSDTAGGLFHERIVRRFAHQTGGVVPAGIGIAGTGDGIAQGHREEVGRAVFVG